MKLILILASIILAVNGFPFLIPRDDKGSERLPWNNVMDEFGNEFGSEMESEITNMEAKLREYFNLGGLDFEDLVRNESITAIPELLNETTVGAFPEWTPSAMTDFDEETTTDFAEDTTQPEEETTTDSVSYKDLFETTTDGWSETEPTQESTSDDSVVYETATEDAGAEFSVL